MIHKLFIPFYSLILMVNLAYGCDRPSEEQISSTNVRAKIIRAGKGIVDIKGYNNTVWPKSFDFKKDDGPYRNLKRISTDPKIIAKIPPDVLKTWSPNAFTNLSQYNEGQILSTFKLIVHGLELKHLAPGLDDGSAFDYFVHNKLNSKVPTGNAFIPYYLYFLHKKPVISTSVISEKLTATFGHAGFILSVPPENYICGSSKDIGTPTDNDFYIPSEVSIHESQGEALLITIQARYPLPKLEDLLPKEKVTACGSIMQIQTQQERDAQIEVRLRAQVRSMGITNPSKEKIEEALKIFRDDPQSQQIDIVNSLPKKISIYNEVAINPAKYNNNIPMTVKITGIFLRTNLKDLTKLVETAHAMELMKVANAFDLPVVLINDGNTYETDVMH